MSKSSRQPGSPGPFRADQIRSGDPYELSNGHRILCLPMGVRAGKAASVGGEMLASDPADQDVGVDAGFSPSPETLRAPDLSVGELPDQPGWAHGGWRCTSRTERCASRIPASSSKHREESSPIRCRWRPLYDRETARRVIFRNLLKLPLIKCAHEARPGEEMTLDRVAEVLLEKESGMRDASRQA